MDYANTQLPDPWTVLQSKLREAVPSATYNRWLSSLKMSQPSEGELIISVPNDGVGEIVKTRFLPLIRQLARTLIGQRTSVEIVTAGEGELVLTTPTALAKASLNPKYTFDQFVIGIGNHFAHACALAVAELPSQTYNPLFIYGKPGLGKTHLLHAIANYVETQNPQLVVRYITADTFINDFLAALQSRGMEEFKRRYRTADLLLVDDIQFLQAKVKTEEEFFHTFNALYELGGQLVLTSDRLPKEMNFTDRLRERFESGLVTDIQPPDFQTRLTILRKRLAHDGITVEDDSALQTLASRITKNVRVLEGALIRVVAYHSLTGKPISSELVTEVLDRLYPATPQNSISIEDIQVALCDMFGITKTEILSSSRAAKVARPRQLGMYLARELTNQTTSTIGQQFGGRNHATVLHACQRTASRLKTDSQLSNDFQQLCTMLKT